MKKIFTTLCIGAVALSAMAEDGKLHYVSEIQTSTGWDEYYFTYNEQNQIKTYAHIDQSTDDTGVNATNVRYFDYNAQGQLVKEEQWQDVFDKGYDENYKEKFLLANWLEYKYNDKGQVIEWTNNCWSESSTLWEPKYYVGSIVRYEYNENGDVSVKNIYNGKEVLKQKEEYVYDSDNYLVRLDITQYVYGNEYTQTMTFNYEDDQLYEIIKYTVDPYDNKLVATGYIEYAYSAQGDLEAVKVYGQSHQSVQGEERYYYEENFPLSEAVMPITWYDTHFNANPHYLTLIKKPVTKYETYELEENSGMLAKSDTFYFTYTTERPSMIDAGVATPVLPGYGNMMVQSMNGGKLTMSGIHSFDTVRVFDAEGRIVKECNYGSGIDMSALPAGAYMVTSAAGVAKVMK